ncbi:ATPase, T2SS/T4P/T4SS family, partial [Acinetobacter baumannii]
DHGEPDVVESNLDSDDIERLRDLVSDAPAIRAVNRLIADAVDSRASDIHLEPGEDALLVRLRVDGMLRETVRLPAALKTSVIARIKVMAGLDIA